MISSSFVFVRFYRLIIPCKGKKSILERTYSILENILNQPCQPAIIVIIGWLSALIKPLLRVRLI
ncbi:hypothetical protein HMPREF0973_00937 [Prevotella veroralis F0319]|uniref:Uncharacterized protein n=1 Tax=Prevotella veroralis F0319 TaxID=649761 RepID=C9MMV2_9BACT|nr:hypothetical protein HMPREF0973_00937 [Prevotella veroralis F0319]